MTTCALSSFRTSVSLCFTTRMRANTRHGRQRRRCACAVLLGIPLPWLCLTGPSQREAAEDGSIQSDARDCHLLTAPPRGAAPQQEQHTQGSRWTPVSAAAAAAPRRPERHLCSKCGATTARRPHLRLPPARCSGRSGRGRVSPSQKCQSSISSTGEPHCRTTPSSSASRLGSALARHVSRLSRLPASTAATSPPCRRSAASRFRPGDSA